METGWNPVALASITQRTQEDCKLKPESLHVLHTIRSCSVGCFWLNSFWLQDVHLPSSSSDRCRGCYQHARHEAFHWKNTGGGSETVWDSVVFAFCWWHFGGRPNFHVTGSSMLNHVHPTYVFQSWIIAVLAA